MHGKRGTGRYTLMNSHDAKAAMLTHMLYRLHYMAAITEYGGRGCSGIADCFGLTENRMTHEFEIKVAKADLAGELAAIAYWGRPQIALGERPTKSAAKDSKHRMYLKGASNEYMITNYRPNRFSFAVPMDLEAYALKALKGTPYGLYVFDKWGSPECKKKADWLHREKASDEIAVNILRKACTEVETLRRQLAKGKRCTKCDGQMPGRCEKCELEVKKDRDYRRRSNQCWAEVEKTGEKFQDCMTRKEAGEGVAAPAGQ